MNIYIFCGIERSPIKMLIYLKAYTPGKWEKEKAKNDLGRSGDEKRAILREWLEVTKNKLNPPIECSCINNSQMKGIRIESKNRSPRHSIFKINFL